MIAVQALQGSAGGAQRAGGALLGFWLGRFTGPLTAGQVSAGRTAQPRPEAGGTRHSSSALLECRGEEERGPRGGRCIPEGLLSCSQELDFIPDARGE